MATLENSKRRLPQAVYARVEINQDGKPFRAKRPTVKTAAVATAKPTQAEVSEIRRRLQRNRPTDQEKRAALQAQTQALDLVEEMFLQPGTPDFATLYPLMAEIDASTLVALGDELIQLRREAAERAIDSFRRVTQAYIETVDAEPIPNLNEEELSGFVKVESGVLDLPGATLYRSDEARNFPQRRPSGDEGSHGSVREELTRSLVAYPPRASSRSLLSLDSISISDLSDWAIHEGLDASTILAIREFASQFSMPHALKATDYEIAVQQQIDHAVNVQTAFKKQLDVEPIGFLHLERLTFAPDGIERGELVYSVPLAPAEEVNIAHKEWATTAQEFEKIVTDSLEEYSEEGVTEKSELSQSTTSQQQHSSGINTGVTASGGYGPVSITSTLNANIADSASGTQAFSRNQSISVTRKASTRSKKEHKVSFKVASAAGTEDQTVRRFKNPYPDKATRVDYYQLIRRWEVNVYRYGIRLTYDITIPEPGSDVLTKIAEIAALKDALDQGFGDPKATLSWASFKLKPEDITREEYPSQAAEYNATGVPKPPAEYKDYDESKQHQWKTADEAERSQFFTLEVTVDEDYEIVGVAVNRNYTVYSDEDSHFGYQSTDDFFGKSGKRILVYQAYYLGSLYVELRVRARLREEAFRDWQLKAWSAIRDAAQSRYYEQRAMLQDRLAALSEELGAQDALSLRKFEREEIMKGVLRWLFGPDFDFVPVDMPKDLYGQDESVESAKWWKEMLAHGELIKFLHHAIEWENVLFFLYPYFWSHLSRWEDKKYLDHPDPLHRAFLRAGSARVVLTIRPGFERDFLSFLEKGSFNALDATHPYMKIVDEMEAFAKQNYPGIPPADPEEANQKEEGVRIGTWHEYTPTSAMDIAFGETTPTA